jgi:hypothetical protein
VYVCLIVCMLCGCVPVFLLIFFLSFFFFCLFVLSNDVVARPCTHSLTHAKTSPSLLSTLLSTFLNPSPTLACSPVSQLPTTRLSLSLFAEVVAGERELCFALHTPTRVYYLQAASEQERSEWVCLLKISMTILGVSDQRRVLQVPLTHQAQEQARSFFTTSDKAGYLVKSGGKPAVYGTSWRKRWLVCNTMCVYVCVCVCVYVCIV